MTNLSDSAVGCWAQGAQGDLFQCALDGLFGAGPSPGVFGLVVAGTLVTSLYIAGDGTIVVPAVVTILLGAVMVPILPPQFQLFAYSIVALGIVAAGLAVWTRFTHQGRF